MNILWLNWKDGKHPGAGGAEVVLHELARRMVAEGHTVSLLTCGYDGAPANEDMDGVRVIRVGNNRLIHPAQALIEYIRNHRGRYDIVIEMVNTAPYFSVFFGKSAKRFLFYHQLARQVWFHEMPAGMSHFGYFFMEPLATRALAHSGVKTITVSDSTRRDLMSFGFKPDQTHIISEGITIEPIKTIEALKKVAKFDKPTLLSLGALRTMKRTLDHIEAFEIAKQLTPDLQLRIAGSAADPYGEKVLARIASSTYSDDIKYLGRVTQEEKLKLMQQSHLILQTAVKEGWGLTVTEAASQGTPAVVYDVDGLRDSVRNGKTGIIAKAETPAALAEGIVTLLTDDKTYQSMRQAAWEWSQEITFDRAYSDLKTVLELA